MLSIKIPLLGVRVIAVMGLATKHTDGLWNCTCSAVNRLPLKGAVLHDTLTSTAFHTPDHKDAAPGHTTNLIQ